MTKILVTAGPTREHLDDVRYLTNGSTGRMGYAIAAAAVAAGCDVVLVSGPTELDAPAGVDRIDVVSARELHDRARAAFADCDIVFGVAAVADHRPAHRIAGKPAKHAGPFTIELVPNPDVLATLGAEKGERVVVGFALESIDSGGFDAALERARRKMQRKHLDLIVLNAPDALGGAQSQVFVVGPGGRVEPLPHQAKSETARWLVERAIALCPRRAEGPR